MSNRTTSENEGFKAKEFEVDQWIDANGNKTHAIELSDFEGKFKVVYCFQSWCPGCHSVGFPAFQKMNKALKGNDKVIFLAVQTVFEGHYEKNYEKMIEMQKQYDLKIPFGHDPGDETSHNRSKIMGNYKTGGTPWFIFIDQNHNVVFGDFYLNVKVTIDFLKGIE